MSRLVLAPVQAWHLVAELYGALIGSEAVQSLRVPLHLRSSASATPYVAEFLGRAVPVDFPESLVVRDDHSDGAYALPVVVLDSP